MSNDLHQLVGRIDERTESMLKIMQEFKGSSEKHDERIASLESTRSWGMGVAATVGVIGSFLWTKLSILLGFHS